MLKRSASLLLCMLPMSLLAEGCQTLDWQLPWDLEEYTLPNGLRVVLAPKPEASSIFARIHVKVGSVDEQAGQSGFAHLFEHMMFKGSIGLKDGDYARVIAKNGGSHNASTNFDYTSYYAEIPPNALEQLLWLESKRFIAMNIDQNKFDNQIEAVLEEKAMRIDNRPYLKPGADFFMQQLKTTPYGHLVIGNEAQLRAASLDDVKRFFERYYVARNMVLVLTGLFDPVQAKRLIKQYFTELRPGQANTRNDFEKPLQKRVYGKYIDPLVPFPAYVIAWHMPGKDNPDYRLIELINRLMLGDDASRLKYKMEVDEKLVFTSHSFPATFERLGVANMGFIPRSFINLKEVMAIVTDELDAIYQNGFAQEEVCRGIIQAQRKTLEDFYRHSSFSELLAVRAFHGESVQTIESEFNVYKSYSRDRVNVVAKQYFSERSMVLEIRPTFAKRLLKSIMEIIPKTWSKKLEKKVLE